jgi:hypothetical protein
MSSPHTIEVRSDVAPDGSYCVAIGVGDDESWIIDRQMALRHAATTIEAVARADYDASVMRQLTSLGIEPANAGFVVADLRADRPPLDYESTAPLSFEPGVSHRNGRGFVTILLHGDRIGQWELDDARHHALACLEVVAAVELDAAYRRALVGIIGLDDGRARAVVGDLAEHRQ